MVEPGTSREWRLTGEDITRILTEEPKHREAWTNDQATTQCRVYAKQQSYYTGRLPPFFWANIPAFRIVVGICQAFIAVMTKVGVAETTVRDEQAKGEINHHLVDCGIACWMTVENFVLERRMKRNDIGGAGCKYPERDRMVCVR